MESEQSRKDSLSKAETVQQLRKTIGQLEGIIQELDTITVEQLPESPSLETLMETTEELEDAIAKAKQNPPPTTETPVQETQTITDTSTAIEPEATTESTQEEIIEEEEAIPETTSNSETSQPSEYQKKPWWIVGILTAIAAILITLGLQLLTTEASVIAEPAPTEIIAKQPLFTEEIESNLETDSEINQELVEPESEITPTPTAEATDLSAEIVTETTPETATKTESSTPEIQPTKKTPIQFTPEQNLITAIQKQVTNLTTSYEPDLLTTIEADLNHNKLLITVENQWYELNSDRQNQICQEMLKRSRQLAFAKLVIQDSEGNLLARSPVVGNEMVILQRTNKPSNSK